MSFCHSKWLAFMEAVPECHDISFCKTGFCHFVILGCFTVMPKACIKEAQQLRREDEVAVWTCSLAKGSCCCVQISSFLLSRSSVQVFWTYLLGLGKPFIVFIFWQIWDKTSLECLKVLTGHTGSVLCLQYDERVIVTGSSDSTVRWVLISLGKKKVF